MQIGTDATSTHTAVGWRSEDYFVPPSLWGAGIGGTRVVEKLPRTVTLMVEGRPFTAIVRDELADHDTWREDLR